MLIMKRLLVISLLCSCIVLWPLTCLANDLDKLLQQLIVGSWAEGTSPYGVVKFGADGLYEAWLYESLEQKKMLLQIKGTWQIKDGELHSLLNESNSPKAPVGEEFIDEIVQLNHEELVLIGVDGEQYSKYRVPE